jgi:hypothetical protein
MADEIDLASDREEIARQSAMLTSRKPETNIGANGRCHECGAPVLPGMRWCDALCRDDWEADPANKGR